MKDDGEKRARILIVEDDPEHQFVITELLKYEGFTPIGVDTAQGALDLLATEELAVAIIDLRLPDLCGTELLQEIRKLDDTIRVIIHTGYASFDSARDSLNFGAFAYVEKPSDPEELIRHVHRAVRSFMEDALRKSETRYSMLAEMSPVGILHTDSSGRCLYVNQRWCEIAGLFASEALGVSWIEAVHPDDRGRVEEAWRAAAETPEPFLAEYRFLHDDGEVFWVYGQARAETDDAGVVTGYVGTVTDITERKQTEAKLREAVDQADAANRAKSQFLANMSHEIRTPMNSIIGMSTFLLESQLPSEEREYVGILKSSAEVLLHLIDSVLDFSRIEAGKLTLEETDFQPRDTVRTVREMLAPRAEGKGVELRIQIDDAVPRTLRGDSSRLLQVLMNLVDNAIKFTAAGFVELDVSAVPPEVSATNGAEAKGEGGAELRFRVHDTGIGMNPAVTSRIFKPFTQADGSMSRLFGGTGLGLAICQRIVALMGGEIEVETAPGEGSTFSFQARFRPARNEALAIGTAAVASQRHLRDCRILIAEDNPVNRLVAMKQVENLGCRVTVVENGLEALEALGRERFDLVLMDCQMPKLDGYEATRRIRHLESAREHLPVIAVTAHALKGEREKCLATGMDDFITKPYREEELAALLDRWLPVG